MTRHRPGPTDHLLDAERRLERLWHTLTDAGDWAEMNEEREAILFAVNDALTRSAEAARQLTPPADLETFTTLTERVGYLAADLRQGIATVDVSAPAATPPGSKRQSRRPPPPGSERNGLRAVHISPTTRRSPTSPNG